MPFHHLNSIRTLALALPALIFLEAELPSSDGSAARRLTLAERKPAELYVTSSGSQDRIARKASVPFVPLAQPDEHTPTIILDAEKQFQSIVGIGGALTDAAAETFARMPAAKQTELIEALFDREKGNGYSLCRTSIHSCDFSSESYSYTETPGDTALKDFSIERDLRYRIPFIRAAFQSAGNDLKLFASPWSPPAWMKSNQDMLGGGTLLPHYRSAWAAYVVRFVREYEKAGVPVWGLTVQNEPMAVQPWESCIFSAEEERDFVRDHLGPALERAGLTRLKLMIWDHNRGIMYQRAKVVYDDPAAARYVWGMGFHWYVGDHFDNVRLVRDAYPDKALVFTEGTVENFDSTRLHEWQWGERYARSMIMDLNYGASGWVDWNVLLDQQGGPNHAGNYCMAPVICDTRTGKVTYMNSYYYIGHFSRFIRPGAKRIICSSNTDDLLATAFVHPGGKTTVVVLNSTEREVRFVTWLEGAGAWTVSPPRSIVTLLL